MKEKAKASVLVLAVAAALVWPALAQPATWTVNGDEMPLKEFIAQVQEIIGKTIVVDQRSRQNNQVVTVLSNVALDADGVYTLFLTVLKVHDLVAIENDGIISIVQNVRGKQEGGTLQLITTVVALDHVPASEVLKVIRPLIPQTGHVAAVDKPNVLIIADYESNLRRLMEVIDHIDVLDRDEIVHRVLEHAWVGAVAAVLEEIAPDELGPNATGPQRVQIVANERNNSLVLRGKARPIAEALRLIERLDVPETTTGAAQVFYLQHADATAIAELLNNLTQSGNENTPVASIQADESLNALIIRADPGTTNELLSTVSQLDVRRLQVLIEAAIIEISINELDTRGVELAAGDGRDGAVPFVTTTLNGIVGAMLGRVEGVDSFDVAAAIAGSTSPTMAIAKLDPDGVSFGAVINALLSDTRANLLSNPSVLTLDNEEATMVAGEKIPFRTGSFTTTNDGASNPFQTINRENVGVTLTVTPHVHEEGSIRMEVELKAGNVVDAAVGASSFADVVTNERELTNTILVDDRQIILLGGLIQDDYRDVTKRVPLLGSIPILGRAFRSDTETLTKRYLMMFLKPTIFRTGADAERLARGRYGGVYRLQGEADVYMPSAVDGLFGPVDDGQ